MRIKKKAKRPEVIQIGNPNRELAWEAWNLAIKYIQDSIGITEGSHAGHFFSDPVNETYMQTTVDLLADYIELERHINKGVVIEDGETE